jgi:metacaspase-1
MATRKTASAKPVAKKAVAKKTAAQAAAKPVTKPGQALSLHIGLNLVSPAAYAGWDGPLTACEFDANDMAAVARSKGIKPSTLLTRKATRSAVLKGIRAAAKTLKSGGYFLLTYSGHGGQVPDSTVAADRDEADGQDETWCLFDGQLIDDELYFELSRFAAGVRVVVLSDSCHSGTVTRAGPPPVNSASTSRAKLMPRAVAMRAYLQHQAFYDKLQASVAAAARKAAVATDPDAALAQLGTTGPTATANALVGRFKPAVLLISGCQDNQTSMDGDHNGAFTEQLLRVWSQGRFAGTYAQLHQQVRAGLPPTQSPNLFTLGPAAALVAQRPFSV